MSVSCGVQVSWVRSRDLQILSHAGAVFTADARVSATSSRAAPAGSSSRHTLRIEHLRTSDAGRYECQINTEPKMSLFFNLTVVGEYNADFDILALRVAHWRVPKRRLMSIAPHSVAHVTDEPVPEVVVSVLGEGMVRGHVGGAATLACEARYEPPPRELPLPPLDIRWQKGSEPVSLAGPRGGVALDTARWTARVESRLTLAELRVSDAGAYSCSAAGRAAVLTLTLDDDGESLEITSRISIFRLCRATFTHICFTTVTHII